MVGQRGRMGADGRARRLRAAPEGGKEGRRGLAILLPFNTVQSTGHAIPSKLSTARQWRQHSLVLNVDVNESVMDHVSVLEQRR
jgi:hypothetical protein